MQNKFLQVLNLGQNTFWQMMHLISTASEEQVQIWQDRLANSSIELWHGRHAPTETNQFIQLLNELSLKYNLHDYTHLTAEDMESFENPDHNQDQNVLHIACGFSQTELFLLTNESKGIWFNGISQFSCPWQAMAETSFNMNLCKFQDKNIDTWRICWMGKITPTAQSLMQVAVYVPYELFMGVPTWGDPEHSSTDLALKAGAKVFMSREPRLAIDDAHIIYIDTELEELALNAPAQEKKLIPLGIRDIHDDDYNWQNGFQLDETFLNYATANAHIVTANIHQNYTQANIDLQAQRKTMYKQFLLGSLYYTMYGFDD